MRRRCFLFACLAYSMTIASFAPPSYGWSERGHNLVARVAARLCVEDLGPEHPFAKLMLEKEHLLGHLANVPDIVWKGGDKHTLEVNFPTHFFDIDEVVKEPVLKALPLTLAGLQALSPQHLEPQQFGTAPFRIEQLYAMMRDSFAAAKAAKGRKELVDAVNQALLYGGIMAHSVGDLAQPLHTTGDHDGYAAGLGGLHAYFEGLIVSSYDLGLAEQVYLAAKPRRELATLRQDVAQINSKDNGQKSDAQERGSRSVLLLSYALTIDSFHHLEALRELDRRFSLVKPSSLDHGMKLPAVRKPPTQAAAGYQAMATQRLAVGSEVLSYLWLSAWREAGSPDLSTYQSYVYPVAPAIIETPYMPAPEAHAK